MRDVGDIDAADPRPKNERAPKIAERHPQSSPLPANVARFEELCLADLAGRDVSADIVVIPLAPCENHGTHLPTGTDIYITDAISRRAVHRYAITHADERVILYPTISLGSATIRGTGSVKVTSRQLRRALTYLSRRFMKQGYRRFVFFSAHGGVPHSGAIDDVCAHLRGRGALAIAPGAQAAVRAYRGEYADILAARGVELPGGIDLWQNDLHAGCLETAMMLAIAPHLVRPGYKTQPPVYAPRRAWLSAIERGLVGLSRRLPLSDDLKTEIALGARVGAIDLSWILRGRLDGYHGEPALATPEFGDALLSVIGDDLAEAMEEVFHRGADPAAYRSSAYLFEWLKNLGIGLALVVVALLAVSLW
ncbi:creatininase family protein [bacterium]|nr:creatininase family protein [bacterium]